MIASAIFGEFIDVWRVFVLAESLLLLALYMKLAYERGRLLYHLETSSARKLMAGALAKHIAICCFILNIIARLIDNWGGPASSQWGFLIQIAYICLIISYAFYERRQIIIRKDGRVV